MADLVIAASVTRTELGLADLSLENPGSYRVVSAGPGSVSWRRRVAASPYCHGEALVSAVKEEVTQALVVRVYGSTAADLNTKTAALLRAFDQFDYRLSLTIDGVTSTWACQPANYSPMGRGELEPNLLRARMQAYALEIPRNPIPLIGAM